MSVIPAALGGVWDLLVVGGGTAGIVAARTAAGFGATVLLAERDQTGGDRLWTGCVPSTVLLAAASATAAARGAARFGVRTGPVSVDFAAVMDHVRTARAAIEPDDAPQTLGDAGVRVAAADVRFTGPRTAAVGDEPSEFQQTVATAGPAPAVPELPGLERTAALTSDTVWDLTELPERLVVLGGGAIGCELAQGFARLGSTITVVEAAARLLPGAGSPRPPWSRPPCTRTGS